MPPRTTLVIPALNEAPIIGAVVRRLRACPPLQAAGLDEVLVVDNGSDDATAAEAEAAGARVVREPRRGYGYACLAGVTAATEAEVIVLLDGDGSDRPEDVLRVWEPVQRGEADLAIGSRVRGQLERGALTPQQRVGNAVGAVLLRALYGARVSDLGPLRAIRRETLLRLEMGEMGFGWSTEMIAKAARLRLRLVEVPVDYRRRAGGESKVGGTLVGTVRASQHILTTIARYRHWVPSAVPSAENPPPTPPRQALFIVARTPIIGQTKTRLGRVIGAEAATDLYRAFLRDLGQRFVEAAARDGYDLYWYYTTPEPEGPAAEEAFAASVPGGGALLRQQGAELGDRLWYGFQALHARGYQRIVVTSSDSPHLPAAWVRDAFATLASYDVVLGPARDGGYYLLGQRGDHQPPADLFSMIQMSTPTVCEETAALARDHGRTVAFAPPTFDIDEVDDLATLRAVLSAAPSESADAAPATLAQLAQLTIPTATPIEADAMGEGGA